MKHPFVLILLSFTLTLFVVSGCGAGNNPTPAPEPATPTEAATPAPPTETPEPTPTAQASQGDSLAPAQESEGDTLTPAQAVAGEIGMISFTSVRGDNPDDQEIYLMDSNGENLRNLTNDPARDGTPDWSPDGKLIAWSSTRAGNREIYVMQSDGSEVRRLTNEAGDDTMPDWSPDGTMLAFTSERDGNQEIYVMNADGSNLRRLTNSPADETMADWSPDGSRLLFRSDQAGNRDIFVMNADGSNVTGLTTDPAHDSRPRWSPDGTLIVWASERDGNREIYVMKSDGSEVRRLTDNPADDDGPVWSPDGQTLLWDSDRSGDTEIYAMALDGGQVRRLTNNPGDDLLAKVQPNPAARLTFGGQPVADPSASLTGQTLPVPSQTFDLTGDGAAKIVSTLSQDWQIPQPEWRVFYEAAGKIPPDWKVILVGDSFEEVVTGLDPAVSAAAYAVNFATRGLFWEEIALRPTAYDGQLVSFQRVSGRFNQTSFNPASADEFFEQFQIYDSAGQPHPIQRVTLTDYRVGSDPFASVDIGYAFVLEGESLQLWLVYPTSPQGDVTAFFEMSLTQAPPAAWQELYPTLIEIATSPVWLRAEEPLPPVAWLKAITPPEGISYEPQATTDTPLLVQSSDQVLSLDLTALHPSGGGQTAVAEVTVNPAVDLAGYVDACQGELVGSMPLMLDLTWTEPAMPPKFTSEDPAIGWIYGLTIEAVNEQGQPVPLATLQNFIDMDNMYLCNWDYEAKKLAPTLDIELRVEETRRYPLWVGNPAGEKVTLTFTAKSIGVSLRQASPEEALAELDLPPANPADIPADNPAAGLPLLDDAIGLTVEDEGYFYYTGANAEAVAEFYSQILAEQGWQINQDLTQISETDIFLNFNQAQGEATVSGFKDESTNTFLVNIRISR